MQMRRKRPLIITLICLIGFAGCLAAIALALSQQSAEVGRMYPAFLVMSATFSLVCFAGLWMMKQWSVFAYTVLAGINQAILIALGSWSIAALVMPGIVVAIVLSYYSSMDS